EERTAVAEGRVEVLEAPERLGTRYYGVVTSSRMALEGVGPELKEDQVRRRQVSYKITIRGGENTEEVEVLNGWGKLTTQYPIAAFIDDICERPQRPNQECYYKTQRNDKRQVVRKP